MGGRFNTMHFYIVDDDEATRSMLADIIEDGNLGQVIGEANDGSEIDEQLINYEEIDILLLDLLMPKIDGLETLNNLQPTFKGKVIMISQIESKELIAKAYSNGAVYYVTKPINRMEVLLVIKNVMESIQLEKSVQNIHRLAESVLGEDTPLPENRENMQGRYVTYAQNILSELGIVGEKGYNDLINILDYLFEYGEKYIEKNGLPKVKDIFLHVAKKELGKHASSEQLQREMTATLQRTRRAIYQSLNHLASLGIHDFMNPTFENYAPKFFDFSVIQMKMKELQSGEKPHQSIRVNTRKFIQVLFFETNRQITETSKLRVE